MDDQSTFDRLVQNLSKNERKELLEKMHTQDAGIVNSSPLRTAEDKTPVNYTKAYEQLTFFERLLLFFKVLFSSAGREDVLENIILRKLGKRLEREHPDIYEYLTNQLLTSFSEYIKNLKESLQFLQEPYSKAFGAKKQGFFAFMVGWRFPEIQQRLLKEIDPEQVAYEKSILEPYQVRKEIEFRLEDIIESIGQEHKELLYQEARRFNTLYHLVFFPFDRILSHFAYNEEKKRYQVSLNEVREALNDLSQILVTLQDPPSEEMIKILFIFHLQKEFETEASQDIDTHLHQLLVSANEAFTHVRFFNRRVPLLDLLRLSKRNLEYLPAEIGGGEDWFVHFKQFWYRRFETKMKAYTRQQKKKKLIEEAGQFLKTSVFPSVEQYEEIVPEEGEAPKYRYSLGFVKGFLDKHFFGDLHGPIKLVLIDGEFYKEQNRDEYNDAYNGLLKVNEEIDSLKTTLSKEGETGRKIERIRSETSSPKHQEQKIRKVVEDTDKRIEQMISRTIDHISSFQNIIGGILYGDVGGRYDTLSNLGYIGRNENKNLSQKLGLIKKQFESFLTILTEIFDTEKQI
ncbi:MAG: DUF5312 family protein [Spirochaetaceae bacterium]